MICADYHLKIPLGRGSEHPGPSSLLGEVAGYGRAKEDYDESSGSARGTKPLKVGNWIRWRWDSDGGFGYYSILLLLLDTPISPVVIIALYFSFSFFLGSSI